MNDFSFKPRFALVFYSENGWSKYYIEKHRISEEGKMLAPETVSEAFLNTIGKSIVKEQKLFVNTSANTLFHMIKGGSTSFAWWIEPKKHELLFDSEMEIYSGMYPMPYLVFLKQGTTVRIYATKEKPTLKTPLFVAPIPNNDDSFCFGSADWDEHVDAADTIKSIEKAVFSSMFTEKRDNIKTKNYTKFYNDLMDKDEFPLDVLKKSKSCTYLKNLLETAMK